MANFEYVTGAGVREREVTGVRERVGVKQRVARAITLIRHRLGLYMY